MHVSQFSGIVWIICTCLDYSSEGRYKIRNGTAEREYQYLNIEQSLVVRFADFVTKYCCTHFGVEPKLQVAFLIILWVYILTLRKRLILLIMKYYFINYKIMEFEVLLIIGLKVTSVIDSSLLLSIMCLLVSLMSHVECLRDLHWDHFCFCCT